MLPHLFVPEFAVGSLRVIAGQICGLRRAAVAPSAGGGFGKRVEKAMVGFGKRVEKAMVGFGKRVEKAMVGFGKRVETAVVGFGKRGEFRLMRTMRKVK
ncbi:hypothetical protein VK86_14115 [Moellerella wisconsensis]|nr:hypothetical protein VK86_14115 [Moellerella wisconsensis]